MPSITPSFVNAFRTTLDLFSAGVELMRQNLRRDHPASSNAELDHRLRTWLHERPGAESGDCAGRRVDLAARRG